jgi:thiol-disulfide isomerase/thioredoxin
MLSSLQGLFGKSNSSVAQPVSALPASTNNKGDISVRTPDEIEDLEKAIKVGPVIFVFVHADWCGHCQTYKPIWQELENAPGRQANMAMIHHDMVEKSPTLKNAKIPGYPTVLKVYPDGRIEDYDEKGSKTNAVPNIRDKMNMLKQLSEVVGTQQKTNNSQSANTPKNNKTNSSNTNSVIQLNKRNNNIKTINLNKLINSLKKTRRNQGAPLQLPLGQQGLVPTPGAVPVSLVARRNISNNAKMQGNDGITVGAPLPPRLPVPPMTGGSLYAMLTHTLMRAGPTVGLLAASAHLPPKKNRGSTLRLTRRSSTTRRNKSKQSKSRKN